MVLLVVLATVWVVLSRGDDTPPAPTGPVVSSPEPGPSAPPAPNNNVPTSAPADVSWTLWYGLALPSSSSAGPRNTDGSGFAHTPTGALVAAAQIPYRVLIGKEWRSSAERQILAGPGRDAFITSMARVENNTDTSDVVQIAGFRFTSYTPETAVVEIVNGGQKESLRTSTVTLRWVDGDWRLVVAPDGSLASKPTTITSLAGYVAWRGVS